MVGATFSRHVLTSKREFYLLKTYQYIVHLFSMVIYIIMIYIVELWSSIFGSERKVETCLTSTLSTTTFYRYVILIRNYITSTTTLTSHELEHRQYLYIEVLKVTTSLTLASHIGIQNGQFWSLIFCPSRLQPTIYISSSYNKYKLVSCWVAPFGGARGGW